MAFFAVSGFLLTMGEKKTEKLSQILQRGCGRRAHTLSSLPVSPSLSIWPPLRVLQHQEQPYSLPHTIPKLAPSFSADLAG